MASDNGTQGASFSYERFQKIATAADAALSAMGDAVEEAGLEPALVELVKLRVSQINRCAFCSQMHLAFGRRGGVAAAKLDLLAVWHEAPIYTARERAALTWAERLTTLSTAALPAGAFADLRSDFSEAEAVHLTIAIANINAWNRIAGPLGFPLFDAS